MVLVHKKGYNYRYKVMNLQLQAKQSKENGTVTII